MSNQYARKGYAPFSQTDFYTKPLATIKMNKKEKEEELDNDIKTDSYINKAMTFKVPQHLEKKNVAYYSILLDLETCEKALSELQKENNEIIRTSLFTTIIILYGKCFTDSSSTNSPKLELSCFESLENLKKLHLNLMSMRHNFVAHRGKTEHELGKAYFQIFPKTMKWGIKVGLQRRFCFESEEIPEYIKLIEYLMKITMEKYRKVEKKIMEHIITNFDNLNSENEIELINDIDSELKEYVMKIK
ncbi:hypothetical protein [Wenyingzhuangia aestuarii]|uniref:hypothetical protein n=1 Tax=Wenyingzhuangia aestuarii TaxID=1647582 RepID=UPI00143C1880|nr:hypothetical protein [Wenyingzhuangia aestuarii]NJB84198.1 hypothetical protein [Wenyingzhuangia aestuarii]